MPGWSTPGESASDYLQDTLGDVLAEILLDCAKHRPDNPVAFVALAFDRKAKGSKEEDGFRQGLRDSAKLETAGIYIKHRPPRTHCNKEEDCFRRGLRDHIPQAVWV